MQNGTIKKLVIERGFGFTGADDGKDYFFRRSGTEVDFDSLQGGEHVTFQVEPKPQRPARGTGSGRLNLEPGPIGITTH